MGHSVPIDDLGARALYPFCVWPRAAGPRGKATGVETAFARNGDPDDIVELVATSTSAGAGSRARVVDPLSWYAKRKPGFFPAILVQAGRQFQDDFEWLACHCGPPVPDPGRTVVSRSDVPGAPHLIDQITERRMRLELALDFVGGPALDRLLVHLVGYGRPMAAFERAHNYPANSGQVALQTMLFRLAIHYGLASRHWRP